MLCFLAVHITNVGHQDLALEYSAHPIVVNASGFLPVMLNFELLGSLRDDLGLHEGSEGDTMLNSRCLPSR